MSTPRTAEAVQSLLEAPKLDDVIEDLAEDPSLRCAQRGIGILVQDAGFDSLTNEALDCLTNAWVGMVQKIGIGMHSCAEASGRLLYSQADLSFSLVENGVSIKELYDYMDLLETDPDLQEYALPAPKPIQPADQAFEPTHQENRTSGYVPKTAMSIYDHLPPIPDITPEKKLDALGFEIPLPETPRPLTRMQEIKAKALAQQNLHQFYLRSETNLFEMRAAILPFNMRRQWVTPEQWDLWTQARDEWIGVNRDPTGEEQDDEKDDSGKYANKEDPRKDKSEWGTDKEEEDWDEDEEESNDDKGRKRDGEGKTRSIKGARKNSNIGGLHAKESKVKEVEEQQEEPHDSDGSKHHVKEDEGPQEAHPSLASEVKGLESSSVTGESDDRKQKEKGKNKEEEEDTHMSGGARMKCPSENLLKPPMPLEKMMNFPILGPVVDDQPYIRSLLVSKDSKGPQKPKAGKNFSPWVSPSVSQSRSPHVPPSMDPTLFSSMHTVHQLISLAKRKQHVYPLSESSSSDTDESIQGLSKGETAAPKVAEASWTDNAEAGVAVHSVDQGSSKTEDQAEKADPPAKGQKKKGPGRGRKKKVQAKDIPLPPPSPEKPPVAAASMAIDDDIFGALADANEELEHEPFPSSSDEDEFKKNEQGNDQEKGQDSATNKAPSQPAPNNNSGKGENKIKKRNIFAPKKKRLQRMVGNYYQYEDSSSDDSDENPFDNGDSRDPDEEDISVYTKPLPQARHELSAQPPAMSPRGMSTNPFARPHVGDLVADEEYYRYTGNITSHTFTGNQELFARRRAEFVREERQRRGELLDEDSDDDD